MQMFMSIQQLITTHYSRLIDINKSVYNYEHTLFVLYIIHKSHPIVPQNGNGKALKWSIEWCVANTDQWGVQYESIVLSYVSDVMVLTHWGIVASSILHMGLGNGLDPVKHQDIT